MSELITKIKKRRFNKEKISFAERYRNCNRCERDICIEYDKEIVCASCGETFCENCINRHQQFCY